MLPSTQQRPNNKKRAASTGDINSSTSVDPSMRPSEALDNPDSVLGRHRILNSKYTHFHVVVFLITFLSYAILHANRKSFSNVKVLISEEWTPSFSNDTVKSKSPDWNWNDHRMFSGANDDSCKTFLGTLDTVFMVSYAVGLFISGPLGDRFNLRYVLSGGMWITSIFIIFFACVSEWIGMYKIYWYVPFWILNGLFQSTAWPAVVAIMGNWFGKSHRGLIFGFWSANASVGNIFGSLIVAAFVEMGYELAILVPAVMLFAAGIVTFTGLVVSPKEIEGPPVSFSPELEEEHPRRLRRASSFGNLGDPKLEEESTRAEVVPVLPTVVEQSGYGASTGLNAIPFAPPVVLPLPKAEPKPVGFFEALLLPGVIIYSVAYACLKLVNYSFFFWLPYYLNRTFHWSQAVSDNLSVWYDVGGIVGGILGGFVSDRLKRSPVMATMLILAVPILVVYKQLPDNQMLNAFGLVVLGFFIGGVANIISAAVCADLGRQPKLRGNTSALSTVTGILDGTGSIGAAIGQLLIPILEHNLGWDAVFYMFIACTILTAICIAPIVYREMRESNIVGFCKGCCKSCCCCNRGATDRRNLVVHEND